jgi:hypothetical protein
MVRILALLLGGGRLSACDAQAGMMWLDIGSPGEEMI